MPDAEKLAKRAKELAEDGKIDELSGLADDKVYLFSGNEDQTVDRPVVEAAKRFYAAAGVPAGSVTLVEKEGGHAFITETEGTACGLSEEPYVSDCDYDQAKAILEWIYGPPLADPSTKPDGQVHHLRPIALQPWRRQRACRRGRGLCARGLREPFEAAACISRCMAASRRARPSATPSSRRAALPATPIPTGSSILFPQIAGSVVNPHGCWDWWGYSDIDYLGKDAPQIKAIWAMAERLATQP